MICFDFHSLISQNFTLKLLK